MKFKDIYIYNVYIYIEKPKFIFFCLNTNFFLGQSEICAVTGGSPGQKYSWYILLEGISFNIDGVPAYQTAESLGV